MKQSILILTVILSQLSFGQVSYQKNKLIKDGVKYKFSKYEDVFTKPDARDYFKKARTNKTVGEIFAYTGGFTLGFGIGRLLAGGNKTAYVNGVKQTWKAESKGWGLVAAGAGLIGIGIPFALAADKNAKKAVAIENGESTAFRPYFKIESAGNGVAMSYNF
ncbi:hypothetical protein [Epilithonimonas arachidiradicis]|uniref:Uncharacterized protein n=1 Tax=Epilithonimonas arachidiradicis TaxID=1617282 RepID=A0A420DD53_9FLAO|nr:hypothetical protein [Epilithonimonas arachidiradicis]RKE89723.1 hypothetical protein BXY58_0299 [Epilithonimonas arachidiradicis]GGG44767.1 hypothetical protein GCM10007332_02830 [Epilithonimonas arachidiradicis]